MIAGPNAPVRFFVEGVDDFHAILHLLRRYNLSREETPQFPKFRLPRNENEHDHSQGKRAVLDAIETAVKANPNESVGFVLDADDDVQASWEAVAHRLVNVSVDAPAGISSHGFGGRSSEWGTRVGVWLMPDNQRPGELEDFLEELVDGDDELHLYAREATQGARSRGAEFPDGKTSKAVLHTWLAWQENPGRPYGTAIESGYLRHDSDAAVRFVVWFRRLLAPDPQSTD
ncbi:DUF3226 domain-containing protein [Candidatus Palauibacter sp.]|uniref:DUF3226 domain-containing protein n=1 Tax=Candidatus Palauibacter sp. TaxID=3101350 RepID=UPI003C6F37A6